MKWSYGITTVPERLETTFPRTHRSLKLAGFTTPHLFVDNCDDHDLYSSFNSSGITTHSPAIRTVGNWVAALWELYIKNPDADRYAIFQDDCVVSLSLRKYLEACPYVTNSYLNLYTFPDNQELCPKNHKGWYKSNQKGLGAVALVFENRSAVSILKSPKIIDKPKSDRGYKNIDGAISDSANSIGMVELVHNPSLVQHIGETTTIKGNKKHPVAESFRGEDFDLLSLKKKKSQRTERIGLIGYNCVSGLGEKNRQLATYLDIDCWLVKPHERYPLLPLHEDVDSIICPTGTNAEKLNSFISSVDTILFDETPHYRGITQKIKEAGKRIVCIACMERMPIPNTSWLKDVDLFICPTKHCYHLYKKELPCIYFPWPVDTERFKFKQRYTCERFLFINGRGGWKGRKGLSVVKELLELNPNIPINISSQQPIGHVYGNNIKLIPPVKENHQLYQTGDILISPHSMDGTGLEQMEAMSCGMPVINTNGKPWNELPSVGFIKSTVYQVKVKRNIDWYQPSAEHLVDICKKLLGRNITKDSRGARAWAESLSFSKHSEELTRLVREGIPK
tara:strand:+ start:39500 stop:41194 length:1695 start_codon:yes stop_codon:yes gene_type:complete